MRTLATPLIFNSNYDKMKTLLIALSLLCLIACKKSNSENPDSKSTDLKIEVSNIGVNTNYLLSVAQTTRVTDNLRFEGKNDTTITIPVNHGDKMNILYNFVEQKPGTNGVSGVGTIKFYYQGNQMGAVSNGSGNTTVSIP